MTHSIEPLESRTLLAVSPLTLDTTFGNNGFARTNINGHSSYVYALAVQSDGKIIAAGTAYFAGNKFFPAAQYAVVLRYNPDGTLDDGGPYDSTPADRFGVNGEIFDFYRAGALNLTSTYLGVAIQSDGKIVLGGQVSSENPTTLHYQAYWFFTRLDSDGSLDTSYGAGGYSYANFASNDSDSSTFDGMVMQPDNKIVVVGSIVRQSIVSRINTSGLFDTTFGAAHTGYVLESISGSTRANAVALDHYGDIVVADTLTYNNSTYNIQVTKYLPNGNEDDSFNGSGKALFFELPQASISATRIALQASGNILVGCITPSKQIVLDFSSNGDALRSVPFGDDADTIVVAANDEPFVAGTSQKDHLFNLTDLNIPTVHGLGAAVSASNGNVATIAPDGSIVVGGIAYTNLVADIVIERFAGVSPTQLGTIKGTVFVDLDGDGVQDKDEAGVPGARVFVDTDNDGVYNIATGSSFAERSVMTDASGNYTFSGLPPATYKLEAVGPKNDVLSNPAGGFLSVGVVALGTVKNKNFAFHPPSAKQPANSIAVSVFNDTDADGKRDIGKPIDPDLIGWSVFLDLNKDGKRQKTEPLRVTNASGNVLFTKLTPGTYRVTEIRPKGWRSTSPVAGFLDVKLTSGGIASVHLGNTTLPASSALPADVKEKHSAQSLVEGLGI